MTSKSEDFGGLGGLFLLDDLDADFDDPLVNASDEAGRERSITSVLEDWTFDNGKGAGTLPCSSGCR